MVNWKSSKIEMGFLRRCWLHCATIASLSFSLSLSLSLSLSGSFSGSSAKCVSSHTVVAFSWLLFGTGPIHNSSCIHRCRRHRWSPAHSAARATAAVMLSILACRSVGSLMYLVQHPFFTIRHNVCYMVFFHCAVYWADTRLWLVSNTLASFLAQTERQLAKDRKFSSWTDSSCINAADQRNNIMIVMTTQLFLFSSAMV
jgi:hypothetical protein